MRDSLLELFRTGILWPVHLGMSIDEILTELGQPNSISHQSAGASHQPSIWLFGSPSANNLQLFIQDEQIKGFGLYLWGLLDTQSLPPIFSAENWQITGQTTVKEFTHLLNMENIKWVIHKPLTFDQQICVLVQSQVHVLWSLETHDGIEKIILWEDRDT